MVQIGQPDEAELRVTAMGAGLEADAESHLRSTLASLLGLQIDLEPFYRLATTDVRLAPLAAAFRGLKPPCFPNLFEALVNAFACQHLRLTLGIRLLNRLAERYGLAVSKVERQAHAFPRPRDLAVANPDDLRSLGLSRQKARAMLDLAQAVAAERLDLNALASLDDATAVGRLGELRGVGRWTAEYVLLRGLGRLECVPWRRRRRTEQSGPMARAA